MSQRIYKTNRSQRVDNGTGVTGDFEKPFWQLRTASPADLNCKSYLRYDLCHPCHEEFLKEIATKFRHFQCQVAGCTARGRSAASRDIRHRAQGRQPQVQRKRRQSIDKRPSNSPNQPLIAYQVNKTSNLLSSAIFSSSSTQTQITYGTLIDTHSQRLLMQSRTIKSRITLHRLATHLGRCVGSQYIRPM